MLTYTDILKFYCFNSP